MSEIVEYTDVMKAGGAILGVEEQGEPVRQNDEAFASVGQEISEAKNHIVLGTSFAIGRGMIHTGLTVRPPKEAIRELKRLAAIGQPLVQRTWDENIPHKTTAEVLLTRKELDRAPPNQARLLETLDTIETFFEHGDVPVVNENDVISHEEITFGSNDILLAILAAAMQESRRFGQVRYFMLTDVNGVYADPDDPTTRIPVIENIRQFRHLALGPASNMSIGGMESKFDAAEITKYAHIPTYIYNPLEGSRQMAIDGEIGTYFPAWSAHNE